MSSSTNQTQDSLSKVTLWPLWIGARVLAIILLLSFFSLVLAITAYRWHLPVEVNGHTEAISPRYVSMVSEWSLEHSSNPQLSRWLSNAAYTFYFKLTRIHHAALAQQPEGLFGKLVSHFPNEISMGMLAIQLFGIRLGNAILMTPFILIVLALATIDGLAERKIRRDCYGHESGGIYEITRKLAYRLIPPVLGLIYLGLPINLTPEAVFVPGMVVLAVLVRMKWTYFQKYF